MYPSQMEAGAAHHFSLYGSSDKTLAAVDGSKSANII